MMMRRTLITIAAILSLMLTPGVSTGQRAARKVRRGPVRQVREVNQVARPEAGKVVAIVGAMLVDVVNWEPLKDSVVIVRGERIAQVGTRASVRIPRGAEVVDATGLALLPGLIDAHFHIDGDDTLPALFLSHGVTSLRDPGQWIEAYDAARALPQPVPRLFLTGPHLDSPPPAYPADSFIVRDEEEARRAVERFADQGASGIKVYFRLPLGLIKAVVQAAHARGLPVTSHLEIVDAADAIRAGVDGIEHVTSLGTALMPPREAEKYRQAVLADNNARREGRYRMWSELELPSYRGNALVRMMGDRGTFFSPTLAVFERRPGDKDTTDVHVRGFKKMLDFVAHAKGAGVRVVIGSHSAVPHAERGWAYQREMELLVEAGLAPMEAIIAGTIENARFFRVEDRLGSIEAGKLADLVLVEGNPVHDITAMRHISRVMLNGRWVAQGAGGK